MRNSIKQAGVNRRSRTRQSLYHCSVALGTRRSEKYWKSKYIFPVQHAEKCWCYSSVRKLKGTSPNDQNSRSLGNRKTSKDKNLTKQYVGVGSREARAQKCPLIPNFLHVGSQGLLSEVEEIDLENILWYHFYSKRKFSREPVWTDASMVGEKEI